MSERNMRKTSSLTVIPGGPEVSFEEVDIQSDKGSATNDNLSMRNLESSELSLKHPVDLISVGSLRCRICLLNDGHECLISPCHCKGTLAYVHLTCLERWLNLNGRNYCELCQYRFQVVQTPRYRVSEALRMWMSHPRIRSYIQADVFIILLLTFVTMGLIMVCLIGLQYFVQEGAKLGITQVWSTGAIGFFLMIVLLGYFVTIYLLLKDQVTPWYRWWRRMVNVRLLVNVNPGSSSLQESVVS